MINHDSIAKDILTRTLTYNKIAQRHNCGIRTVQRVATERKIGIGQGRKHYWKYGYMLPQLAYILGIYLTEGHLPRNYCNDRIRAFIVNSTSCQLLDRLESSLEYLKLPFSRTGPYWFEKSTMPQFRTSCYCSVFARWLHKVCDGKKQIPLHLLEYSKDRLAFLEGVIDGDGSVKKDGTIRVRGSLHFIHDLPKLLELLNIRTTGLAVDWVMPNGKPYWRVYVNRADFRKLEPQLAVPLKHQRLYFAKDRCRN